MLQIEQIKQKLLQIGYKPTEIEQVFADVSQVVLDMAMSHCFKQLPTEVQERLRKASPEECMNFIQGHSEFKQTFAKSFEQIHDETWLDYFKSVTSP